LVLNSSVYCLRCLGSDMASSDFGIVHLNEVSMESGEVHNFAPQH